jgi:hypothetical protein
MPDCGSSGQTKTVSGWIGDAFTLNTSTRNIAGRTVELTVTITDPFQAQRAQDPTTATQTYRTILTLNRDTTDP